MIKGACSIKVLFKKKVLSDIKYDLNQRERNRGTNKLQTSQDC